MRDIFKVRRLLKRCPCGEVALRDGWCGACYSALIGLLGAQDDR